MDAEPHVEDVLQDGPAVLGKLKHLERRSRGVGVWLDHSHHDG